MQTNNETSVKESNSKIKEILHLLNTCGFKVLNSYQGKSDNAGSKSNMGYIEFKPMTMLADFLSIFLMRVEGKLEFLNSEVNGMTVILQISESSTMSIDDKWEAFYDYITEWAKVQWLQSYPTDIDNYHLK